MTTIYGVRITLATLVTCTRIFLIPFIIFYMLHAQWGYALAFFSLAAVTDVLDGFLARFLNEQTWFGAYVDPVADKLLMVSCLATLTVVQPAAVPSWLAGAVFLKELVLVLGALAVRMFGLSLEIKPSVFGKGAMFLQVLFVASVCANCCFSWVPRTTFVLMTYAVFGAVILSLVDYLIVGVRQVRFVHLSKR